MAVITKAEGHVQEKGWAAFADNGNILGTTGERLRLEALKLWLELTGEHAGLDIGIEYEVHEQDDGWSPTYRNGEQAGTTGQSKRLEAIRVKLIGKDADKFDVKYHLYVQDIGWMAWSSNGESSGTEGKSLRVEALQIVALSKGIDLTVNSTEKFIKQEPIPEAPSSEVQAANNGAYGQYFTSYEFACDCIKGYAIPDPCNGYPATEFGTDPNMHPALLQVVNEFRAYTNMAVIITCGTRCPSSNDFWGGVPNSLHLKGYAFDCTVPGLDIVEAARIVYQVFGFSVRVYPNQGFMHVEISGLDGVYNQEQGYYIY